MAFETTRQEILKQAIELKRLYDITRIQKYKDEELRLRRIVAELESINFVVGTPTLDQVSTAGNTTANLINVGGITSDYFQLDTAATPTLQPGMFAWNDQDGTANLRLKGGNVTLQVGQETLARVVNKTGADLLESQYKVVRVRIASEGGSQGQRLAVVLAQGNNDPDSVTTLGLVTENIANNQEGFITIFGNVNGINTTGSLQGETWVDGDVLFLSPTTPGALTKVKPVAPNHTVVVGYVLYAHGVNGKIFVKVDNGYELDELHNVKITSVANNDLLQYDSTQQVWKNVTVATAVPTPTLAAVTTAGNTTSNSIIYSGATEAIRPSVDSTGALGASNYRWLNVYTRGVNSGANSLDILGTNINLNDNSGNIKLRVFGSTGNVVIQNGGTFTDAGYRLDVQGNTRVNGGNTSADIPFIINNRFQFKGDGALVYGNSAGHGRLTWDGSGAYFGGLSGYGVGIGANGVLNHLFINTSGNVGIGTTSPSEKLHVVGNGFFTSTAGASLSIGTGFQAGSNASPLYTNLNFRGYADGIMAQIKSYDISQNASTGVMIFSVAATGNILTEYMRITTVGRVGIGTTSPTRKLTLVDTTTGAGLAIDSSTQSDNFYIEASKAGSSRFSVYENSDVVYVNSYGRMVFRANQLGGSTGFFGFLGGNLLINTSTDSGYKLNVNGTAFIGGVATLNSDANIAGNVSTPQITARRYYQNPNGVPSNNLGDPTVTEMALFDEQFDNKTAFYPAVYGSSILTFETYNGTTWTDISSTITDTDKKKLFGGDNSSNIVIPYGTVQYQITINNPGPYVYLNALYAYWSGNGHSTQVHIWKKHNSGSWVQHTNSTTTVSSWPGHLYLPFSTIPWHPAGTLGTHYNQIRVVFTPGWNSGFPANGISLYKTQWWGGYPASKRVLYTTNENRGVVFPGDLTATGALTSTGTFTANGTASLTQLTTFGNSASFDNAGGSSAITFKQAGTNRGILGTDASIYGVSTSNIGLYVYGTNDLELSTNNIKRLIVKGGGNVLVGITTDSGYKLDVNGTTRVQGTTTITPAANTSAIVSTGYSVTGSGTTTLIDLSGTWNTTGTPTLIKANVTATATGGLSSVKLIDLQIGGSSCFSVNGFGGVTAPLSFSAGTTTSLRNITFGGTASENTFSASSNIQPTAGTRNIYFSSIAFTPTSGTATLTNFIVAGSINQTGGANGITRGLYVNPTLTAAADWRSVEWSNNTGWGLYGAGTGLNYLNGALLIGTTTNAGYKLDVNGTARIQSDLTVASLTTDGPVKSLSGMLVSVAGYTGSFTVPTNPPGMQTLDIQDGIIVNIL